MRFDRLTVKPCLVPATAPPRGGGPPPPVPCCDVPEFREANPIICAIDDSRCSDPAFAAANPSLCPNAPRLILKPAFLLKDPLQQVAYEAVLLSGGKEMALTGVTFGVVNPAIAQMGATSGKLTTLQAGITTVSAVWGGLRAYGQVEVLDNACATHSTNFLILIDDSASMGIEFGGTYATKLDFAKDLAVRFVQSLDLTKDSAAVYSFDTGAVERQMLTAQESLLMAAIQGIAGTTFRTNLAGSLEAVMDDAAALPVGENTTNVIVLFTDGENKTGGNPLPVAASFQSAGGILMVCGVRSYDGHFTLLDEMASGGFFCNAYPGVEAAAGEALIGMKGYLCAGFCEPPGDTCIPYAKLNYNAFVNWDVSGKVDLIGDGGQPLFDLLPGHGLYVDMCGSSPPWLGGLVSKTTFSFTNVPTYRVRLKLAGNQRQNVSPWTIRVRVGSLLDEIITITDWKQDFTEYSLDFIVGINTDAKLEILTDTVPAGAASFYGLLLDEVVLESSESGTFEDDTVTMLSDDFDDENETCFPPNCGNNPLAYYGVIPYYGYCPAQGCLDELPVPAQAPDPNPTVDIEPCIPLVEMIPGCSGAATVTPAPTTTTTTPGGAIPGHGSPEGVVTAVVGQQYIDLDSDALWYKKSGTGKTGWQPLLL